MWNNRLLSSKQFTPELLNSFFNLADAIQVDKNLVFGNANGKILCTWFNQPSTRTKLSFQTAMLRLGGQYIDFQEDLSSIAKGESIEDTARMLNNYCDILVVRHSDENIFNKILPYLEIPVINAGNGNDEHPTQALIDLYTIWKHFGYYEPLTYLVCGNSSRTIRSLCFSLCDKNSKVIFVVNEGEYLDDDIENDLYKQGVYYQTVNDLRHYSNIDVIYANRDQGTAEDNIIYPSYLDHSSYTSENAILLHPLPRVYEIHPSVDVHPKAKYFLQASYAVPVRMAILGMMLGL